MDVQDQTTHTGPSGHESHHGHGVHLCHRCGWPFPNPHPSAKHRRAHKKICGTIEGYTNLIGSEVVSDDEHHPDDDKEQTPSPKIEKKTSIDRDGGDGDGEIRGSFTRSEDEMFADAVTEFADSGSANKTLDKDLFLSFKDAENTGTNEVVNTPIEISKVDTSIEVSEKTDSHVEKIEETEIKTAGDSSESRLETCDPVKDEGAGPTPKPSHASEPQEAKSIDVTGTGDDKAQESQTSETITAEAKDSEITKMAPEVSETGGYHDNSKQENFENLESVTTNGINEKVKPEIKSECEHVSEVVKESETGEEIKIKQPELDQEIAPEVVTGSEIDNLGGVGEEFKHEKFEADHKQAPEVAKESEIVQTVSVLDEKVDLDEPNEQIQEVVKKPFEVLTEKKDLEAATSEKSSIEQIQEAVKEPVAVSIEKEDLEGPQMDKHSIEHTHENPECVLIEKDSGAPEQIQETVKEPAAVLIEKEYLEEPQMEKQSIEHTHENPESILTEKDSGTPKHIQEAVKEPETVLTEKEDLGILTENVTVELDSVLTGKEDLKSENCSKDEVIEQKVIADVGTDTTTLKEACDNSTTNNVTVDSSSPNSLEGTWGSVSVISTASIDAETLQLTEKSKVNSEKSNETTSDVFEPPSFMTLVEPESKDNKSGSSEVQDSHPQPNSEASQAGWFPTLTQVNNESEGRKKNEEAMAKVANFDSGKQSTPLKNLLGEARSPSGKQPEPVVQKDEAAVIPPVNDDVSSPPKLIEDVKKEKKGKSRSLWVPFVCCSSVNAVK
ncbi:hypothetical protein E3N88_16584 [Mikania micrantha]|uniref:C2H2-type domain-containing protein n=1 Tax=Mikania micrantha TaxID=192012 RepID=A0A5N6NYT7_9ASTR|nr:hypothetical protein E3N88_16584 [Mikania micrantha]